jgi:RNA polymerase sigma factor (sigma-70 family)
MSDSGSVTRFLEDLGSPDLGRRDAAAAAIWERYYSELLRYAASHFSPRLRQRADAEDVLQSVFKSLYARMGEGSLPNVGTRDELIRFLVVITRRKTSSLANFHTREKRDMGREMIKPHDAGDAKGDEWDFYARLEQNRPTDEEGACFADTLEHYMALLPAELRPFVLLKMEGYTDQEIADKLGCSVRRVERKKSLIREYWQSPGSDIEPPTHAPI